jgi:TonB family protein
MMRKGVLVAAMVLLTALAGWSQSSDQGPSVAAAKTGAGWGMMKMRVFEGLKEGTIEPVKVVTASYLNYAVTASIQSEADAAAQQAKLKQIFNLKDVSLLTEADLVWDKGKSEKAFHFFRIDKQDYLVMVTPVDIPRLRFRIEIFEQKNNEKTSLLDTEFTVAPKNAAVFGFGAADGKPYFISMQTIKWPSEVEAQIILGSDAVPEEGPVRAVGNIQPPRLIKQVDPAYPEAARKARVEGVVILEAQTDKYGRVQNVKILRSIPLLDQAAVEAVRQWVYEPKIIDGKARGIVFTVTVRFVLNDQPRAVIKVYSSQKISKEPSAQDLSVINMFAIAYPKEAIEKGLQGDSMLEAVIDETGKVAAVRVIKGIAPVLDKAAIDALRAPTVNLYTEHMKPASTVLTVKASFTLPAGQSGPKGGVVGGVVGGVIGGVSGGVAGGVVGTTISKEEAEKLQKMPPVKAEGSVMPPTLIKQVDPIYPEEARAAGIEGTVILEAVTDVYGRVDSAQVLRSIPGLDIAAIDAVKQWIYEPLVIDGKPRRCLFTVTVRFTLK